MLGKDDNVINIKLTGVTVRGQRLTYSSNVNIEKY